MTEPISKALFEVTGLRKSFAAGRGRRLQALDGVDLQLGAGETLGVVGESGCGKSTLARILMRLDRPDSGDVRFAGADPFALRGRELVAWLRRGQMVFQDPYASLNPRMTAAEIISEPWRVHRDVVAAGHESERVGELLEMVGMRPADAARYPAEFSGGQRQRIGIARALALDPDVVICDEPVSALDLSVQAQVLNLLSDLQARLGIAYVFISHDLTVVHYLATRVAVMYLGRVVETGPAEQVFARPRHPYTAALLSAAPQLQAGVTGRGERIVLTGDLPSPTDPPSGCGFRTRCWKATDACAATAPALVDEPGAPDHAAACHYPLAAPVAV